MNSWDWILLLIFFGFIEMHFLGHGCGMHHGRNRVQQPNEEASAGDESQAHQNARSRQHARHGCC